MWGVGLCVQVVASFMGVFLALGLLVMASGGAAPTLIPHCLLALHLHTPAASSSVLCPIVPLSAQLPAPWSCAACAGGEAH